MNSCSQREFWTWSLDGKSVDLVKLAIRRHQIEKTSDPDGGTPAGPWKWAQQSPTPRLISHHKRPKGEPALLSASRLW